MKILVVDDEPLARERLLRFVEDIDSVSAVATASNGFDALEKLKAAPFDIVLLDIRMPGQSGLEVARTIRTMTDPPAIIFCTAYDEHALEAFKVNAEAYLLKPVQKDEFIAAIKQCQTINRAQKTALATQSEIPTLVVQNGREKERIPLTEVYYLKADQKYVSLFCVSGERVCDESLKALEERFSTQLVRIHRNALVLKSRVQRLSRDASGGYWLQVEGVEEPLSVSRRFARELKPLFHS
ncbi:LytTR family DNA-binding domain-containing protein [Reinekea marina]|uniref:LytR/AlgR family response regulator transcription factor n=1 Tax=Reinekea marina TaxID=1310421 RepID=A0ABV7WP12_9GAMM|nr:LytTR family DNA-binding domain-containing protein [Reinekea marina]MDN3648389.1 LytTR family DNA-binding domain-containing protein [Reinekea marina]